MAKERRTEEGRETGGGEGAQLKPAEKREERIVTCSVSSTPLSGSDVCPNRTHIVGVEPSQWNHRNTHTAAHACVLLAHTLAL